MKNARSLLSLTAVLLMPITFPLAQRGADTALRPPAETAPHVVADSLPVPWCKAGPPHCIGITSPNSVADSLPVPWGKKPGGANVAPQVVADSLPVPWGKKPGGVQSWLSQPHASLPDAGA
jgi:hypothetical protein